jgi:hypothetical protein
MVSNNYRRGCTDSAGKTDIFLNSLSGPRGERVRVRRHSRVPPPHHRIESTCGHNYGRRALACILRDSGRRRIRHTDMRRLRRLEA